MFSDIVWIKKRLDTIPIFCYYIKDSKYINILCEGVIVFKRMSLLLLLSASLSFGGMTIVKSDDLAAKNLLGRLFTILLDKYKQQRAEAAKKVLKEAGAELAKTASKLAASSCTIL